jgi:hypothetical protein
MIAKAHGLKQSDGELQQLTSPLQSLYEALQPLIRNLPPDLHPTTIFRADPESRG